MFLTDWCPARIDEYIFYIRLKAKTSYLHAWIGQKGFLIHSRAGIWEARDPREFPNERIGLAPADGVNLKQPWPVGSAGTRSDSLRLLELRYM